MTSPKAHKLLMRSDALRLARKRRRARNAKTAQRRAEIHRAIDAEQVRATERFQIRHRNRPAIQLSQDLPIRDRAADLIHAIAHHQVVIVAGETGSGKSTQLPKLALAAGRGTVGLIGHTQPRRIAARSIAERLCEELEVDLGTAVGYKVRFHDEVGPNTYVKVMTDGVLLAELQSDRNLDAYDTIIIDEAHERSLNIDFLLGSLRQLIERRADLHVIITSATIDTQRFSEHFNDAPVITVEGRSFPVEVRYHPVETHSDVAGAIADAVDELAHMQSGDILVFCAGERDISDAADAIAELRIRGLEILPLYARLSAQEQHRVFEPHHQQRVVLATNVAETSLTVPNITGVVDPGFARVSRYSQRTKVQRLPIEPISQASANQRAGRCGRVAPGICIRLYDEDDYSSRPEFTDPEITRTNLASVILAMASARLGPIGEFPFIDRPDNRAVADGIRLLTELGAVTTADPAHAIELTKIGADLARLPVDPQLGRMVIEANERGCLDEVIVVAAALSIQDPRLRPSGDRRAVNQHTRFERDGSDVLALLELWRYLREQRSSRSGNQFRKMCQTEDLQYLRIREWQDITAQLARSVREMGWTLNSQPANGDDVHISVLAGFVANIGIRIDSKSSRKEFRGTRGTRFAIWPGSAAAARPPEWIMAAELVETQRLWARMVAPITPSWVLEVGDHLIKRTYGEPYWDSQSARTMVRQRSSLYGLAISDDVAISLHTIDAALARDVFIQSALIDNDWYQGHDFCDRNDHCRHGWKLAEQRSRGRLATPDDHDIFEFFDATIPADVFDGRSFDRWWAKRRRTDPTLLDLDRHFSPDDDQLDLFPDSIRIDDTDFEVIYEFDPGTTRDGATIEIPVHRLASLQPEPFKVVIPGHAAELAESLVRALPKSIRKQLHPLGDTISQVREEVDHRAFATSLCTAISARIRGDVSLDHFDVSRIPGHLLVTYRIIDADGAVIGVDTDLGKLRRDYSRLAHQRIEAAFAAHARSGITAWTVESIGEQLPQQIELDDDAHTMGYLALVDELNSVGARVFASRAEQLTQHWDGLRRLARLNVTAPQRHLKSRIGNQERLTIAASPYHTEQALWDDITDASIDHIMGEQLDRVIWTKSEFDALVMVIRRELPDISRQVLDIVIDILTTHHRILQRLDKLTAEAADPVVADVTAHLQRLVHPGCITASGTDRIGDIEQFVAGIERRLDRLPGNLERDLALIDRCGELERRIDLRIAQGASPSNVEQLIWTMEHVRRGLFGGYSAPTGALESLLKT